MNGKNNKAILGLVAGAVILTGAVLPFTAQAATGYGLGPGDRPGFQQRHVDPDKMAQRMADTFGVSKEEVLKYQQQGARGKDLFRAAFLAKAGNISLQQVMAAKTYDNSWRDVAKSLGITKEKIKAARMDIASSRLEQKLSIPKQTSLSLMEQGYRGRDIAVANSLSKNTGKPIGDILAMRKINNTWRDVAETLGVSEDTFRQDIQELRQAFPHHGRHGHFQPKPM